MSKVKSILHVEAGIPSKNASISDKRCSSLNTIKQLLIDSNIKPVECLLSAAFHGFFPDQQPPEHVSANQSCNAFLFDHLEFREYSIRCAQIEDLPALLLLEERCWAEGLRTSSAIILDRISKYPEGQLALVIDDEVVGVIYSQSIVDSNRLNAVDVESVDALHTPDSNVIQLLAINVNPDLQHKKLGDQLLEFMLIYRSLQHHVQSVVAITLCKKYDRHSTISLDDYIHLRNEQGGLADPILRFHELHGASIERVMPGYRPNDLKNQSAGVLVSYDIRQRSRKDLLVNPALPGAGQNIDLTRSTILASIQVMVTSCLGEQNQSALSLSRPLMEMGLDSADLLELREKITHQYSLTLTTTFFFQYNTVEKIIDYLSEQLIANSVDKTVVAKKHQLQNQKVSKTRSKTRVQDVAIIGMACRLPGGINTPEQLWQCLHNGTSVIKEAPEQRLLWPDDIDPENQHKGINRGGYLETIACFDAPFFRISPVEAELMDPQQRILLELSWQTIEQAGYCSDSLRETNTGVFIGASGSDYARLLDQSCITVDAHYSTGNSMAVLANRISYFYDFHGTSLVLDTACSSSLVAVHKAVQSIQAGESSQALVGGINIICHPANSIAYYKAGMLAIDGCCKTFDQQANGYVRSEGAVMLMLKPLAAALSDHDQIHAVIKGSASNHGGQASGLTAPNPERQTQLLKTAWKAAEINPFRLGYIEAHGTGTRLGDPIEIQGLKQAFSDASQEMSSLPDKSCGIGSVKTNLGHLEAAAGITGLLKAMLCLQHRQIPTSLHFKQLNEQIDLADSNLSIIDKLQTWVAPEDGGKRLAGISSFGSGGANAHVVLEESESDISEPDNKSEQPLLFVLSAKARHQLKDYVEKYLHWLTLDANRNVRLSNLVYTLQIGRQAMPERLAIVVTDYQDLHEKLTDWVSKPDINSHASLSEGRSDKRAQQALICSLVEHQDLNKIGRLWQSGISIDWSLLYSNTSSNRLPRRINTPTYPFAKHRYWLPSAQSSPESNQSIKPTLKQENQVEIPTASPRVLAPVWRTIKSINSISDDQADHSLFPELHATVLIIGGTPKQRQSILAIYKTAISIEIDPDVSIEALAQQLQQSGTLDHILWIAPEPSLATTVCTTIIDEQDWGLLYVFKLVKALLVLSYDSIDLGLTLITCRTQAVFHCDEIAPAHAGVHGLTGSLAKEYPRWSIRSVDLENHIDWSADELMRLPIDDDGEVLVCRSRQWYRRYLCPVQSLPESSPAYRQQGVYVVIGGAGGIGEAWSRSLIKDFQAQIIWIGRRELDATIQEKLDGLTGLGCTPIYLSADASNIDSLQAAYTTIKQKYQKIHGVIHSAVGLFDHSLAEMDGCRFREILSAKIDISVHIAEVFKQDLLDFILYFSSTVSLEKYGGLSGYAAGGAFEDAFAMHLAQQRDHAVKVINWGHWEIGTGDLISDAAKTRLQLSGIIPIQPEEAMPVLDSLLTASLHQLVLLKTAKPDVISMIDADYTLNIDSNALPHTIDKISPFSDQLKEQIETLKPLSVFNNTTLEAQLLPLLAGSLNAHGLLDDCSGGQPANLADCYHQWLQASRKILADHGFSKDCRVNLHEAWEAWEKSKQDNPLTADMSAVIELLEACLQTLPEILSGTVPATDIIFPASSMRRVEGIYRNNAVADYYNQILGESLVEAIKLRLQKDPAAQLRILEIGAGSGGTTAMLLPLLSLYQKNVTDYCYTDVSKAFLFHAEEQFVEQYPFVHPQLFDVEKPLYEQSIELQQYDFVIATNVLHATRNIRRTLTNVKATLHKNGLLFLNEISTQSLFAHLTFGLLDGWWLSEDQYLRIPDAPGLYPEVWQRVLQQQGFSKVKFPAQDTHLLGQQVIIAESDGVVIQKTNVHNQNVQLLKDDPAIPTQADLLVETHQHIGSVKEQVLKEASNIHLKKIVAQTLRMNSADIDALEPLETYGIDSILVVQITNALRESFPGVSTTLLFECQTIDALSDYFILNNDDALIQLTGINHQPDTLSRPEIVQSTNSSSKVKNRSVDEGFKASKYSENELDAIAVVGISCRFPQANTVDEYWQILQSGQQCVRQIPEDRWPLADFYHADPDEAVQQGKSYSQWGGFLDNVTDFDPLFFNISPKEAISIDPQERLFLQTAWEALEDAGYTRDMLAHDYQHQVGVFVGITRTGFDLFGPQLWQHGHTVYPHTSFSSVANRLSYFLNARGPSMPVDTMCSSSLTAIHQACQSLKTGDCQLAIAGGVNLYLHPSGYVGLSASRMLSKDGICRSFGKDANGFVPGEGVGVVVLKPLSRAIRDNDQIYATIRASHVNHGGKTNGYTVPNPHAQADLIREALQKANIDARAVSYIEAHGTGTELGDPIEVSGLTQAFQQHTGDTGFCALGSVKSNLGHLEAAAGISGFIKVILQMQHGQIAPSLHSAELNPNINFEKTPFVVQQSLTDWNRPLLEANGQLTEYSRVAGISSFGAGGANAHVILEEFRQPDRTPVRQQQDCLIVLSAKDQPRLKAYINKLLAFIHQNSATLDLADLAYTLQIGREQMDQRLAMVVHSLDQLQEQLKVYTNDQDPQHELYQGHVKSHKDVMTVLSDDEAMHQTVDAWFKQGNYSKLLKLWTTGMRIDWERLYQGTNSKQRSPRRISLPTYPFATTRYWLPVIEEAKTHPTVPAKAEIELPQPMTVDVDLAKPSSICLKSPIQSPTTFHVQTSFTTVSLAPLQNHQSSNVTNAALVSSTGTARISVYDLGNGIASIDLEGDVDQQIASESVCTELNRCLQTVKSLATDDQAGIKVLLIKHLGQLLGANNNARSANAIYKCMASIADCVVPVIAVLSGDNRHDAILVASACDLMICTEDGRYSLNSPIISEQESQLFAERFGEQCAAAMTSSSGFLSGRALKLVGLTAPVVKQDEIDTYVFETAQSMTQASTIALTALKRQLSIPIRHLIDTLTERELSVSKQAQSEQTVLPLNTGFSWAQPITNSEIPQSVEFDSRVVSLEKYSNGVLMVHLCDRSSKNTFSEDFVNGVIAAFEHINSTSDYKVAILTGYDNYFACGGTKQGLLDIQNGSAQFTDEQSYSMPLRCHIPVIAAMQGHAIGAGWAMGLYCDWAVYSEESIYQSPYMLYGFTPGAGSTCIFPERFGLDLSREILFTAREYQGRELSQRGLSESGLQMTVVPRSEVCRYALALADHLALSSRQQLIEQKDQRCRTLRECLHDVFSQELAMHEKTFVGNPAVIEKINQHFNDGVSEDRTSDILTTKTSVYQKHQLSNGSFRQDVLEVLRLSLQQELQMQQETIDDNAAFIDMGLDSITAVTWIRKVNKQFGLSIGATKVYSYPTLELLTDFVMEELAGRQVSDDINIETKSETNVLAWLRETLARELLMKPDTLDNDMKFVDMGLDSITAVTWIRSINKHYELSVGATKVYSYPCLSEFYAYLLTLVSQNQDYQKHPQHVQNSSTEQQLNAVAEPVLIQSYDLVVESNQRSANKNSTLDCSSKPVVSIRDRVSEHQQNKQQKSHGSPEQSIAIIGMAGQFPKADNLKQFWQNLAQGKECISDIPETRWNIDEYYHADWSIEGKTVCKRMGLLDNVALFDPLFFNISPSEAEYMDPQQRLFLQSSWHCIEDAGYNPADLSGSLCGVFVGCAVSDYHQSMTEQTPTAQGLMGESVAMLPARIAYFLNLHGPSMAIDTACSSSLVAMSNACDSLLLGHSDLALAGGVYVINGPDIHVKMSKAGMLSPDGRCFSFDQRANGFVPGEGVGVMLLKRLDQAQLDSDDIYAVIRGWGVNQDGRTNGITAPNQESQTRLETSIYKKFGINPEHIELIEAHGTATKLGDPIEVDALRQSFSEFTNNKNYCALSSVKSNIGHLATAAGVSGAIKSVLALQNRQLPPTINYQTLNEHINLEDSPFYVNTQAMPWESSLDHKRLVAVSSFGFSGTNAHMVLEETNQQTTSEFCSSHVDTTSDMVVLVLSAKTKQQLSIYAQAVSDYFAEDYNPKQITLADIAYTFQIGRTAMSDRLAVVANSAKDISKALSSYAKTGKVCDDCFTGDASQVAVNDSTDPNHHQFQETPTKQQLINLAESWVKGDIIDWQVLNKHGQAKRKHGLPTYPFAAERYWIPESDNIADTIDTQIPVSEPTDLNSDLWHATPLSDTIDWQYQLQHYQTKNIVLIYSGELQRQGFADLFMQLRNAAGLVGKAQISYCCLDDLDTGLAVEKIDVVLCFASHENQQSAHSSYISSIEQCLHLFSSENSNYTVEMVFSVHADQLESNTLAAMISEASVSRQQQHCMLVTHSDSEDTSVLCQRLYKEWLAFDTRNCSVPVLNQIHYQDGQRLARKVVDDQHNLDDCYLINKEWQRKELPASQASSEFDTVLILVSNESLDIAKTLIESANFKESILIGDSSILPTQIQNSINYKDPESARISANILIDEYEQITHIIDLSDLYQTAKEDDVDNPGKTVFYQTIIGTAHEIAILYFTKGLQQFKTTEMSLAGAKFAGLVKMLSAEYPHISARFIDIDQSTYDQPQQLLQIITQEFNAELQETELCYRNGQRFVSIFSAIQTQVGQQQDALQIDPNGVYVISGGTNGVGLEIAKHLVANGCKKLILMGVTALPPRDAWQRAVDGDNLAPYLTSKLVELIELDKAVEHLQIYTGSITSQYSLKRYFKKVRSRLGSIKGVIHSAGVYSDSDKPGFVSKDLERMQQVWEPKVNGLESLDTLFKADSLDFFVSFTSMTGQIPHLARGAADYAMANSFVEYFSAYQHHQNNHHCYKTIIWSDWNQTGAITRVSDERVSLINNNFNQLGMRTFSNQEGCALFDKAMSYKTSSSVFIGYLDLKQFNTIRPQLLNANFIQEDINRPALISDRQSIIDADSAQDLLFCLEQWEIEKRSGLEVPVARITDVISLEQIKQLEPSLIHRIHKLLVSGEDQQLDKPEPDDLEQIISQTVQEVLKLKEFDPSQPFQNYGLDSISAMVLATRLEKKYNQPVQPQWLIDYSTVESLTRHLQAQKNYRCSG